MRFALHSFQLSAKIFHISFSWMYELLFKYDELSNANKGHIRISRCFCVGGCEYIWKTKVVVQTAMCCDFTELNSSVKVHVVKWPLKNRKWERIWFGGASVKSQFSSLYSLCLQCLKKVVDLNKNKKNTQPAQSGTSTLSHPNILVGLEGCSRKKTSKTQGGRGGRQA